MFRNYKNTLQADLRCELLDLLDRQVDKAIHAKRTYTGRDALLADLEDAVTIACDLLGQGVNWQITGSLGALQIRQLADELWYGLLNERQLEHSLFVWVVGQPRVMLSFQAHSAFTQITGYTPIKLHNRRGPILVPTGVTQQVRSLDDAREAAFEQVCVIEREQNSLASRGMCAPDDHRNDDLRANQMVIATALQQMSELVGHSI